MLEIISEQLQNQFLSGGIVLMIFGSLLAVGRGIPHRIYSILHRSIVTTVDVSDQDECFYWMQEWLDHHSYSKQASRVTVSTQKGAFGPTGNGPPVVEVAESSRPPIFFSPAPGYHVLRFENHWLLLHRIRNESKGSSSSSRYWRETFVIQTFCRDRGLVRRLMHSSFEVAFPTTEKRVRIYDSHYAGWRLVSSRLPRMVDSVVLRSGLMDRLLQEIETFESSASWYQDRGIPYQLGYLLHGSPGNGKTSLALALASQFNRSIYLARVSGVSEENFRSQLAFVPQKSIVLVEDVDCFFNGRRPAVAHDSPLPPIPFSSFLNAIDGVTGSDGKMFIFTSNHPEKLDPALLRPGRVDHQIEMKNATQEQAKNLFLRFFEDEDRSVEFSSHLKDGEFSMAELQGIFLKHRNNAQGAVDELRRMNLRVVGSD